MEKIDSKNASILKCLDKERNIHIDIIFDKIEGFYNSLQIKKIIEDYPIIKIVYLVIKYIFKINDFIDAYKGTMSSIVLFMMCYALFFNLLSGADDEDKCLNLGYLFKEFFFFYGHKFNYNLQYINTRNCCFIDKAYLGDNKDYISLVDLYVTGFLKDDYTNLAKNLYLFHHTKRKIKNGLDKLCYSSGKKIESYLYDFLSFENYDEEKEYEYND